MDLSEQLKKLFPDHEVSNEPEIIEETPYELFVQKEPMICKYEKRKGKPTTIISGYEGEDEDFKILAKEIKSKLAVGGTFKDGEINNVFYVACSRATHCLRLLVAEDENRLSAIAETIGGITMKAEGKIQTKTKAGLFKDEENA